MSNTTSPDGKVHRHPDGGYFLQLSTLLDDKPAVATYRIYGGTNGGSKSPYWITEATVRLATEEGPELPVFASAHGSRVVLSGHTKRHASGVYWQARGGYVTHLGAAYRAKFAPAAIAEKTDEETHPST